MYRDFFGMMGGEAGAGDEVGAGGVEAGAGDEAEIVGARVLTSVSGVDICLHGS